MTHLDTTLDRINGLTASLIAQTNHLNATSTARTRLIHQALTEGHTPTEIAKAADISRQRISQLTA